MLIVVVTLKVFTFKSLIAFAKLIAYSSTILCSKKFLSLVIADLTLFKFAIESSVYLAKSVGILASWASTAV